MGTVEPSYVYVSRMSQAVSLQLICITGPGRHARATRTDNGQGHYLLLPQQEATFPLRTHAGRLVGARRSYGFVQERFRPFFQVFVSPIYRWPTVNYFLWLFLPGLLLHLYLPPFFQQHPK